MKRNRVFSFIIICLAYFLSIIIGVIIYDNIQGDVWIKLLISDIIATIVIFIFSLIFKNASIYDPYWSVQPVVIITLVLINNVVNVIKIFFTLVIILWGIRLTTNWAYNFKNLEHQDWRYTMLKEKTKSFYPFINLIGIHMVPTLIVYMCILPAVYVIQSNAKINVFSIIFLLFSIIAIIIQGVADFQMHIFRKNKRGGFMRDGLWKYSRHPNYFGEIMMWWGIGLATLCLFPKKWYFIIGAIMNTLLFLFVSIPMADKRNRKRGDFEQLKKETRMLLPIRKEI